MTHVFNHHAKPSTLAAYAAGVLDAAMSVVLATHLDLCPDCDRAVRDFESLGGVSLERFEPVAMSAGALDRFWAAAGATPKAPPSRPAGRSQALGAHLAGGVDAIDWKPVAPGMAQHVLAARCFRRGALRLLRIEPGVRLPKHSHTKEELTLILRGAYEDELGVFHVGDLADLDSEATHSPCAIGDEPCICLIAANAPLAFKGLIGKVTQPFVGM